LCTVNCFDKVRVVENLNEKRKHSLSLSFFVLSFYSLFLTSGKDLLNNIVSLLDAIIHFTSIQQQVLTPQNLLDNSVNSSLQFHCLRMERESVGQDRTDELPIPGIPVSFYLILHWRGFLIVPSFVCSFTRNLYYIVLHTLWSLWGILSYTVKKC